MTTKGKILKAIREKCLDCCCNSPKEVKLCQVGNNPKGNRCSLYPFRFGSDPNPSKAKNPNPTFGRVVNG
jgi:hypothetical protein